LIDWWNSTVPSKSKAQRNLMAMVANNPKAAKRLNIPQSVGQEYMKADKRKKFAMGGPTSYSGEEDSEQGLKMSARRGVAKADDSAAKGGSSFNEAFRAARKDGLKTFKWRGGTYGTELASESKKPSKAASATSIPKAAPAAAPKAEAPKAEAPVRRATAVRGRGAPGTREIDKQYAENRRGSYLDRINPFSGAKLNDLFGMREQEKIMRDMGVDRTEARRRLNALEEAQESEGMRRGGKVKRYASGGSVSSASKRADGCATKGKTRGKFI
jgi:hypothetical protein